MNDGQPPQDLGAERQLLGALLVAPQHIDDVAQILQPGDMYRPAHEAIYTAILVQHNAGEPVDPKLIGERLRVGSELARAGGLPYLADLVGSVLTATNATYYADIVARTSALRAMLRAGQRIQQIATADDVDDVGEVQARARQELDAAITVRARDQVVWAHESVTGTLSGLEDPPHLFATPWGDIDHIIGGYAPGRLYVVGARPGVGKTVWGVQSAAHHAAVHGRAALVATLEMSRREIDMRLISQTARVDYTRLELHKLTSDDWDRIAGVQGKLADLPLTIVDRSNMLIDDVRRIARTIARERDFGMVVVDYLQLMAHPDHRMPRHQQVAEFSRSLKLLARELEIPVLAMSQLNRASEQRRGREPGLHDLRESGAVEQDADVVILLHRDVEDPDKQWDMKAAVAKNRHGPTGMVKMRFQGHHQRIDQTVWRPTDVLDNMPARG